MTTIAGAPHHPGLPNYGSADGRGTSASFSAPHGVAMNASANFAIVADIDNNMLRRIDLASGLVTRLAGLSPGFADGLGAAAAFRRPIGVAVDAAGSFALIVRKRGSFMLWQHWPGSVGCLNTSCPRSATMITTLCAA